MQRWITLALFSAALGFSQDFRWNGSIAPGRAIEIKNINGSISAERAISGQVEVTAVKKSRHSDPNEVKIVAVEHADGVTVCAVYPSDDPAKPNECLHGKQGRNSVRNNDVNVEFTVRVPAGVRLTARSVNGKIDAQSLQADVEAYTVNGGVKVSTSESAQAHTVNGSIVVSMRQSAKPSEFHTVNGSIALELAPGVGAEIAAECQNGRIESALPVVARGSLSNKRLAGTIGGGGAKLSLKTVNGSINIK